MLRYYSEVPFDRLFKLRFDPLGLSKAAMLGEFIQGKKKEKL